MATKPARVEDVLPLNSPGGNKVGEVQVIADRFTPPYYRVLTGRVSECRVFYFKRDMTRWVSMLGLVITH